MTLLVLCGSAEYPASYSTVGYMLRCQLITSHVRHCALTALAPASIAKPSFTRRSCQQAIPKILSYGYTCAGTYLESFGRSLLLRHVPTTLEGQAVNESIARRALATKSSRLLLGISHLPALLVVVCTASCDGVLGDRYSLDTVAANCLE